MRGLLLGLFGFVGFFVAVSLLVTRIGLVSAFGTALLVNLVIHGAAYLILATRARCACCLRAKVKARNRGH